MPKLSDKQMLKQLKWAREDANPVGERHQALTQAIERLTEPVTRKTAGVCNLADAVEEAKAMLTRSRLSRHGGDFHPLTPNETTALQQLIQAVRLSGDLSEIGALMWERDMLVARVRDLGGEWPPAEDQQQALLALAGEPLPKQRGMDGTDLPDEAVLIPRQHQAEQPFAERVREEARRKFEEEGPLNIAGKWPGEETDEEIRAALDDLDPPKPEPDPELVEAIRRELLALWATVHGVSWNGFLAAVRGAATECEKGEVTDE